VCADFQRRRFYDVPSVGINLYKAAHGLVNAVLHVAIGLPITTVCRCSYARNTRDYNARLSARCTGKVLLQHHAVM
jgi:hypothetical protein